MENNVYLLCCFSLLLLSGAPIVELLDRRKSVLNEEHCLCPLKIQREKQSVTVCL